MLRLEKNQTANLIVTVTELTTISPANYLFQLIHEQSFLEYFCILPNISVSTERFDEFVITDGVDVMLDYDGFYTYNIYQQASSSNLDPLLSDGLVETGRLHVFTIDSPGQEYDNNIQFSIYE
jgi:hypothetical protein